MALFAACSSFPGDVTCVPLPIRCKISTIYIVNDSATKNENFENDLVKQLVSMGYHVENAEPGTVPDDGYALKYEARYGKSLSTLNYIKIEVSHGKSVVGYIISDASDAPAKYGSAAERMKPVIDRLFQFATPVTAGIGQQ